MRKVLDQLNKAAKDKKSLNKRELHKIIRRSYKKAVKQVKIKGFERMCKSCTSPYNLKIKLKRRIHKSASSF